MILTLTKEDNSRTVIKCDYIRVSGERLFLYVDNWVHHIASLMHTNDSKYCLKIFSPRECVDSFKVVYGISVIIDEEK